jgi:hypothetical protein
VSMSEIGNKQMDEYVIWPEVDSAKEKNIAR